MNMSKVIYLPQAKWKAGERRAFKTTSFRGERFVPAFMIPPAGSFDSDEQRVLSPTEYLRRFGHQLAESRGRQLAFIDAGLVDDERHRQAVDVHPLTELLERAWLSGANAAPIFSQANSVDYKNAVRRFLQRDGNSPVCLRVSLSDLEGISSASELEGYVLTLGGVPERTVLLIDGGPLQIDDPDDLAHLLAFQMARLVAQSSWLRVFWSATTLPEKPKLAAGQFARFPRNDWELYKAIMRIKEEFPVVPMYSDYMLEYPANYQPTQASPTAKLMYSTESEYVICKGRSTRFAEKYGNIFPVANQLSSLDLLENPSYSLGDAYIHRLASGTGKTGNASMWRWCSTDHHLAMVEEHLSQALGISREITRPAISAEQLQLV